MKIVVGDGDMDVDINMRAALSIPEFCQVVGIGRSRTYAEIKLNRLRVVKVGRRTLIPVEAVWEWLNRLEDGETANVKRPPKQSTWCGDERRSAKPKAGVT